MVKPANYWIENLGLQPHIEGGYFKEIYRAEEEISHQNLPDRYHKDGRSFATCIYFMIVSGKPSRLHRLKSDEVWHFYAGSPMTLYIIHPQGELETRTLGPEPAKGHLFQTIVPYHCWFGGVVNEKESYSLVGCYSAPGFEYEDLEIAQREDLKEHYPQHADIIDKLT